MIKNLGFYLFMVLYLFFGALTIIFCGIVGVIITTLLNLKGCNDSGQKSITKT